MDNKNAKVPTRGTKESAGLDSYSPIDITIWPGQDISIPLGWRCEFPEGFVMIATNKSGRSINDKLIVGADTIDSDYRGIVHAHIFNLGEKPIRIKKGEKIVQFVIFPCWTGKPRVVSEIIEDTERGSGTCGSTGIK